MTLYRKLVPLPIQYRDYAVWQKQKAQRAEHERQLEYWTEQLADSTYRRASKRLPTAKYAIRPGRHYPALYRGSHV